MTSPTTEPAGPAEPEQATEDAEPAPPRTDAAEDTDPGKPGREAAKYRRQLRETEAERDGLRGRLESLQRREVETLAAADLHTPADLWMLGATVADLLDDDGAVDPARVTERVAEVLEQRPGWRRTSVPSFDGGARTTAPAGTSYQDVLRGHKDR